MPMRVLALPGPIMLVPGRSLELQMNGLLRDHPSLPPTPPLLVEELKRQTAAGGVPAILAAPNGRNRDWSLLLHTRTCVVRLYRTKKYGDAYTIASVNPLRSTTITDSPRDAWSSGYRPGSSPPAPGISGRGSPRRTGGSCPLHGRR